MAEQITLPVNGNYATHQQGIPTSPVPNAQQSSQAPDIPKDEVAWYFVERYYNTLSRSPEKLALFFNKRSQFVAGIEEEKVPVCIGQRSINDRIKELDFQDCKVRVTNVDSQTSDNNIVIQVIGEMSNKSAPHRKFVQTFVLAAQTNGYFVLNDIFRYIAEEEEEAEQEELQHESSAVTSGVQEPAPTGIASVSGHATKETVTHEPDILEVDKKLEIAIQKDDSDEEEPPHVNGTSTKVTEAADETPAAVAAVAVEDKPAEPEIIPTEEALEEETPKDHTATPAPEVKSAPMVATTPTAPPKPALPKTWAQLAGANRSTPAPAVPASTVSSTPSPAQTKSTSAAQTSAPTSATPVAESSPARQPSPADSAREGSSGGWQTAGAEHSRKASRAQTQPTVGENGRVRAYVKNVYATVDADELKSVLSQYGELAYFDVSRQKNSAFVEFATVAGFNACVAANPHKIGSDNIYVEERRPAAATQRGGSVRGRGGAGFDSRTNQGRGGFTGGKGEGAPRGGGYTARGGRGGTAASGVPSRPRPQAV